MRRVLMMALAGAALAAATPASATIHGFCNSTAGPCVDNGSNTPTTANPPNFGFWSSPGGETGTLLIDILIPNNLAQPSSFTLTGLSGGPFTASIFNSTTAWTSGQLDTYLGLSGASPTNPIGAYIQPNVGQTGWWVYQANLGSPHAAWRPDRCFHDATRWGWRFPAIRFLYCRLPLAVLGYCQSVDLRRDRQQRRNSRNRPAGS